MPLVDHLEVAEDHPVLALLEVLRHRDLRGLLLLAGSHVVDVLATLNKIYYSSLLDVVEVLE